MASKKILVPYDFNKNEIQNAVLQVLASAPGSPSIGQFYYDSTAGRPMFRGASAFLDLTARANHTGSQTAATISDFDNQVRISRLDQLAAPTADVSLNGRKLTNVATPTVGTDGANKQYVDDQVAGLSWKNEVRLATTAAGTLSTSFANGSTIDGVALVTGDRILIKDQASGIENGIYVVAAAGAPTRATDADSANEINGAAVFVTNGTVNGGQRYVCNTTGTITLGSTAITFVAFGGGISYVAGNGLLLTTNSFSVVADTGIVVTGTGVKIDVAVVARKVTALVGNGSLTSIPVTHSLANQWVTVQVFEVATLSLVECDVVLTDANTATLIFVTPPATNQYRVVIVG